MNRNGKIALGCGGAGCLGVILLVIVFVVLIVTGTIKAPGLYDANRNSNSNFNFNSSNNNNSDSTTNSNDNNSNANSNSDSSTSDSSSMSEDDKHKLFQAAAIAQDGVLNGKVWAKLGLMRNHTPTDAYQPFVKAHISWLFSNTDFLQTVNTPEKGRAYVDEHIDD
jgi:Sec-independent protein translocase protein TatA